LRQIERIRKESVSTSWNFQGKKRQGYKTTCLKKAASMAAGTEIAQPVSALDGAYKPLPLDDGNLKENGAVVDNKNSSPTEKDVVVDMDKSGRPPRPVTTSISASTTVSIRGCVTHALISSVAPASGLVAHEERDAAINGREVVKVEFQPVYRSGVWSDTGRRPVMEDAHVRIDDLETHLGPEGDCEASGAFYGVFDGHGGKDAASYVKENVLRYILDDVAFPTAVEDAMRSAFLRLDDAFAKACSVNHDLSSGTTALTALLSGRFVLLICSCLSRFLPI
jgi:protein phosphatase 2C family protein 2/3